MKRFQFGLDKVRLWRHEQAEVEEAKLQRMNAELQLIVKQKLDLQAEADLAGQSLLRGTSISAEDLGTLDSFRQYVHARTLTLEAKRTQCQSACDQQRQAVTEARRRAELLDRMKEKNLAQWRAEHDKEQENLSTELFLAKRRR